MSFNPFARRQARPAADPALANRYDGKPLLILLDNFVLACIGALTDERYAKVGEAVSRAFGAAPGSDWMAELRTRLELGPGICDGIRDRWQRVVTAVEAEGKHADPVQFAREIVDRNFAPLLD